MRRSGSLARLLRWGSFVGLLVVGWSLVGCALMNPADCDRPGARPGDGEPPLQAVVLVDTTDGASREQRTDVWSRVRPYAESAPRESRFHFYQVRSGSPVSWRSAGAVNRPPHRCEVNHLDDNPDRREEQWESGYLRPLRDTLGNLLRAGPSDSSAILQALHASARHFGDKPDATRRLILISDLVQNAGLNFYRDIPSFGEFLEEPLYRDVATRHLAGVEVTVLRLRPGGKTPVDETALVDFWRAFFEDQGARAEFLDVEGPRPRAAS